MALYRCVGEFTYSSRTNRDACLAQVQAAVAGYPTATGWAGGPYAAGVTTQGNTAMRVSYELPDEATAVAFERAVTTAAAVNAKTAGALALALVGTS